MKKKNTPPVERAEDLTEIMTGHGRCTVLLLSLLGLILIAPYAPPGMGGRIVLTILLSLVLAVGAYVISRDLRTGIVGIVLGGLGVLLQFMSLFTDLLVFALGAAIVFIVFLIRTFGDVMRYLLRKGPVTADKLHGALAGYIMLALLWAMVYTLIENVTPGSFNLPHFDPKDPHGFYHLLYFSFSTLTTVGYGDITPVSPQAISVVILEQFCGVFFVGVLIARLAGIYTPETNAKNEQP